MFWWGEGRDGEARWGRVSMRYMSMKPRIRERPIQAWGVRWGSSGAVLRAGASEVSVSSIETLSGSVGVLGGSDRSVVSVATEPGMTGPGMASMACSVESALFPMMSTRSVSH